MWYRSAYRLICFSLLISLTISCKNESSDDPPAPMDDDKEDTTTPVTTINELLSSFMDENGGESAFSSDQIMALDALLSAQDDIEAGRLEEAATRINNVFAEIPVADPRWDRITTNSHCTGCDFNFGSPIAYYGLRMLKQIIDLGDPEGTETLTMTAVVAPCAEVKRPTLPNYSAETVNLDIAPEILADDGQLLKTSTALFRRWVQAITGGLKVDLRIYVLDECTTVDFQDNGVTILSYPDAQSMVSAVPEDIAEDTDFWWVVAPSGVPGDGSGFNRHFITGGMGAYGTGLPLFLSDDAWFTRKPAHLGTGEYHELEVRTYHPQWFQHEFMHHLYREWNEFDLEKTPHQWFDRTTWPSDFIGSWEPDYYAESVDKRFLAASPSLAEGLKAPPQADFSIADQSILLGDYERRPVQNGWHQVEIVLDNGELRWQNAAGVSWSLRITDGQLWSGPDCPYGEQKLVVLLDASQQVTAIYFQGEEHVKIN